MKSRGRKLTLGKEVIEAQMLHIIETRVRLKPYIAVISKKQLWWGDGIFKNSDDLKVRKGLIKVLGIRVPTDVEIEKKNLFYGYPALQKPWNYLNTVTNPAVRQRILWKTIDGGDLSDIRVVIGRGYIRKDNTLDPDQTQGISCWVLFLKYPELMEDINKWIEIQEEWVRFQILRNQLTHREVLTEQKKRGSTLVKNNRKLLKYDEYLRLDPAVDRSKITWNDIK